MPIQEEMHKGQRKPQAASLQKIHCSEICITGTNYQPGRHSAKENRSIQSEGAFGVIKQNYGFRQFLLRGNKKVTTEIMLLAMSYNINKLHSKIQNNRTGMQLFIKDSA